MTLNVIVAIKACCILPPPAAVVDRPCASERGDQEDTCRFDCEKQREDPHDIWKGKVNQL